MAEARRYPPNLIPPRTAEGLFPQQRLLEALGEQAQCKLVAGVWQTPPAGNDSHMHEFYARDTSQALPVYKSLNIPEKIASSPNPNETILYKVLMVGVPQSEVTLLGCIKTIVDQTVDSVVCTFYSDVVLESK